MKIIDFTQYPKHPLKGLVSQASALLANPERERDRERQRETERARESQREPARVRES